MYLMPQAGQRSRASSSVCGPRCWPIRFWRMAGRFSSFCLISCWASAQAWHRCVSFFSLLTISVKCTVAGLEQNWHFTPFPFLWKEAPRLRFGLPGLPFRAHLRLRLGCPRPLACASGFLVMATPSAAGVSTLLQTADMITKAGGLLVGLLVDRLEQLLAKLHQL